MVEGPIKVLRIVTRLNIGGPARQIDSLIEHLDPKRFQHIVVTGEVQNSEIEHRVTTRLDIDLRRVSQLGRSVRPVSDLIALFKLIKIIRHERPHIVHTHLAKAGLLGRIAAWIGRVPVRVHTFHGHLLSGYFTGTKLTLYVLLERFLTRLTNYQICVGERVRQDLIASRIVSSRLSVAISPGISAPEMGSREITRRELGIDATTIVILFVGRLVEVKRLDRFVNAINAVSVNCPNIVALIVGHGPEREKVSPLISDPQKFIFTGWQENLGPYYSAADIVCLTSDNEGMPISLIEAALSGIATVTTDAGSAREVVIHNETGVVVPINDFSGLVSNLSDLVLNEKKRLQYGSAAKRFAENTFSATRLAQDHSRLYECLTTRDS